MTNHHLLVETPDANLSRGMRQLNGVYTQRFNRNHARFVSEGKNQPSPWEQRKHQVFLGPEEFATQMQHRLPRKSDLTEISRAQRRPLAQSLIHYEQQFPTRDAAIAAAYASGGFTMKAIGGHFGLHYSRVIRIIQQQEKAKDKTRPISPHFSSRSSRSL